MTQDFLRPLQTCPSCLWGASHHLCLWGWGGVLRAGAALGATDQGPSQQHAHPDPGYLIPKLANPLHLFPQCLREKTLISNPNGTFCKNHLKKYKTVPSVPSKEQLCVVYSGRWSMGQPSSGATSPLMRGLERPLGTKKTHSWVPGPSHSVVGWDTAFAFP